MNNTALKPTITIVVMSLAASGLSRPDEDWTTSIARSVRMETRKQYDWASPSAFVLRRPPSKSSTTADPTIYYFDGKVFHELTSEQWQSIQATRKAHVASVNQAKRLVRNHELNKARALLITLLQEDDLDPFPLRTLAELSLHELKFSEALALLAPLVHVSADKGTLTMAAYATAMQGDVYPGQKQYCDKIVLDAAGDLTGISDSLPVGSSIGAARISATLARATWYKTHGLDEDAKIYFDRALKLDPTNAWASLVMGQILGRQRQWALAVTHLEVAVKHGKGRLQQLAKKELRKARSRTRSLLHNGISGT